MSARVEAFLRAGLGRRVDRRWPLYLHCLPLVLVSGNWLFTVWWCPLKSEADLRAAKLSKTEASAAKPYKRSPPYTHHPVNTGSDPGIHLFQEGHGRASEAQLCHIPFL